jgi:hypothetical protein
MTDEASDVAGIRDRLQAFFARSRLAVIIGSGVLALVVAFSTLSLEPTSSGRLAFVGLFGTLWALALAIAIYIVSSRETQGMLDRIEDLTEQVASLAPRRPAKGHLDLVRDIHKFHDYVEALRAEFPVPAEDIVDVRRPGTGKGNRPVIIATRAGRRYSVFRGGRSKSGYTVTALPEDV